jgi:outer membrane protein TolC
MAPIASASPLPHDSHPDPSGAQRFSFAEALRRGASEGPLVKGASQVRQAASSALRAADMALAQAPAFQAQVGPRLTGNQVTPEVIVSVVQPWNVVDAVGIQRKLAEADVAAALAAWNSRAQEGAEAAGLAWIDLALADARLAIRGQAAEHIGAMRQVLAARVASGAQDAYDLALADAELALARDRLMEAEGDHFLAASDLAYALGHRTNVPLETGGDLAAASESLPPCQAPSSPTPHPEQQLAQSRALVSEREADYAVAQNSPSFGLGLQYQREGTGDHIGLVTFTAPVPIFQPWTFHGARARIQAAAERATEETTRHALEMRQRKAQHECFHAEARLERLNASAAAPHDELLRLAELRFAAGSADVTSVLRVREKKTAFSETLADALADVGRARLRAARAKGILRESQQ